MNKKIIFALICGLFMAVSMTSCKKDQTCTCTTTITDKSSGVSMSAPAGSTKIKDTKKKAKTKCEDMNKTYEDADDKYETKCTIQ